MGRANISVAIISNFNANGINAAMRKMEQLAVSAVSLHGTVGKGWVDAGAKVGTFGAQLSDLGGRIAKVGDRLTAGVTVPMAAMGGAAIATATKIDTAWYDVRKTADMTEREYEELKRSAIELSTTQPRSRASARSSASPTRTSSPSQGPSRDSRSRRTWTPRRPPCSSPSSPTSPRCPRTR